MRLSAQDRCELRLFEMYLKRRAERPDEDRLLAYAEIYGEVVYDKPFDCLAPIHRVDLTALAT
jgi:hypothetical protein